MEKLKTGALVHPASLPRVRRTHAAIARRSLRINALFQTARPLGTARRLSTLEYLCFRVCHPDMTTPVDNPAVGYKTLCSWL
jgi:hypothetical protein